MAALAAAAYLYAGTPSSAEDAAPVSSSAATIAPVAFTPAPGLGGLVLDLDSFSGHFSAWRITDLTGINTVRTTLQIHRLGDDPQWAPGFSIALSASDDDVVYFRVEALDRQAPLIVHMFREKGTQDLDDRQFKVAPALNEKLDVSFGWTPDGVVTVTLGDGETASVALGAAPTKLHFLSSTGDVEFNPLSIGHTTP
jgi:hypothetical protein